MFALGPMKLVVAAVLIGLAFVTLTAGRLFAQTPDASPTADHMAMMDAATPAAGDVSPSQQMEQMMELCASMMSMMMGMMDGEMSGDMGGQGTPAPMTMEQMRAMMQMMTSMMDDEGMAMDGAPVPEGDARTPTAVAGS